MYLTFASASQPQKSKNFIIHEFLAFAKEHPILLGTNILLAFTFPIDDILVPFLLGMIVTRVENRKNWLTPLVILVSILVMMQIIYTLSYWHDAYVTPTLQTFIKNRMIRSILHRYDGKTIDFNTGEVQSRLVKIPISVVDFFATIKNYVLPYMLSFIITATIITRYNKTLGLIVCSCAVAIFVLILTSPSICKESTTHLEQTQANLDEETDDILNNLQNIFASNNTKSELDRLATYEASYRKAFASNMACIMKTRTFATVFLAIMVASFVYLSNKGLRNKTLTAGVFVTILSIITQWFGTLGWLAGNIRDIVIDWGIISSFQKDYSPPPPQTQSFPSQLPIVIPKHLDINITNLVYTVPNRSKPILDSLSIEIKNNERIAIIGEIGSGKTTFLKMLLGLNKASPSSTTHAPPHTPILINDQPIDTIPRALLRQIIGYVPQNPILFNRTILENIKYGIKRPVDDSEITTIIDSLGLKDMFEDDQHVSILHKSAGKRGANLSGGQRQIISALRALLQNPKVLILDEVTSSIDSQTKEKLFRIFDRLFVEKTVIIVTHDKDMLRLAKTTYRMKEGKLFKEGNQQIQNSNSFGGIY